MLEPMFEYVFHAKCPYCGATFTDSYRTDDLAMDGDEWIADCRHCDQDFCVTIHISYTYSKDTAYASDT